MTKPIEFTVSILEATSLEVQPNCLSYEQYLIRFMRDEKGLSCLGNVHLFPLGELTWVEDKEEGLCRYTQYVDR